MIGRTGRLRASYYRVVEVEPLADGTPDHRTLRADLDALGIVQDSEPVKIDLGPTRTHDPILLADVHDAFARQRIPRPEFVGGPPGLADHYNRRLRRPQ